MNQKIDDLASDRGSDRPISSDMEQISRLLPIRPGQKLLELGCGRAETTCMIANRLPDLDITGTEVDSIQHAKNTKLPPQPNVTFMLGGAEQINLPDNSVDYVLMLKSLHHVPIELMSIALGEISRVLVSGGLAYISEPVYAGEFNEILRLFHDEKLVREAAIDAIERSITEGQFELVRQLYFDATRSFEGFEDFERLIIGATHTDFQITKQLMLQIQSAFQQHVDPNTGLADFRHPLRVDLLRA